MDDDSIVKGALGQLGGIGKQLGKNVADESKKMAKTTAQQVGFEHADNQTGQKIETEQGQNAMSKVLEQKSQDNQDLLKSLYGKSESTDPAKSDNNLSKNQTDQQKKMQDLVQKNPEKTPEEIQKIQQLQQQLHKDTYYDPTFNPERRQQEEEVEEQKKEQEEEQKKMGELEEKKEKEEDKKVALQRSQTKIEANRGVSG